MSELTLSGMDVVPVSKTRTPAEQALLDTNLILVGQGAELARRARERHAAGGRMTVLWTAEECSGFYESEGFVWSPPSTDVSRETDDTAEHAALLHALQRDICGGMPRKWFVVGADVVPLQPGMRYELTSHAAAEPMPEASVLADMRTWQRCPGIRVLDGSGVQWEVSGHVMLVSADEDVRSAAGDLAVKDPFRMPVPLYASRNVAVGAGFAFVWMTLLHFVSIKYEASDLAVPVWRLVMALGAGVHFTCLASDFFGPVLNGKLGRPAVWNFVVVVLSYGVWTIAPFWGTHVTLFWVCFYGTVMTVGIGLPAHCYSTTRRMPSLLGLLWLCTVLTLAVGTWVYFYGIAITYVFLYSEMPGVAAIFLPLATATSETLFVTTLGLLYRKIVYRAGHVGDQAVSLTIVIGVIHSYAESTRLASLLCGTVIKNDYAFVPSMVLGLFVNLAARYSWSRYCVARVVTLFSPRLSDMMRPNVACKLHDEVKFSMGYPRFVVPISLMVARLAAGQTALFNTPALVCVVAAMAVEAIEDAVVFSELLPFAPPLPRWAKKFAAEPTFSPNQLFQARRSSPVSGGDLEQGMRGRLSRGGARLSVFLQQPGRALALHGARELSLRVTVTGMLPTLLFILFILQLILGMGHVYGVCPTPLDPSLRVSQGFVWARPLPCG